MTVLLFIVFTSVVSIGFLLCAFYLRSRSIATLNLFMWAIATFIVQPWSYLGQKPSMDPDQQFAWDASLVWAAFFILGIIALIYCLLASVAVQQKPGKRRRRRRSRSKNKNPDANNDEIRVTNDEGMTKLE